MSVQTVRYDAVVDLRGDSVKYSPPEGWKVVGVERKPFGWVFILLKEEEAE